MDAAPSLCLSLSCHAAWVLCPLPCFSGMQTLFEWTATWTSLTWKHKQKPAGWNQMTGNWRSYAASISTWWLLYLTIALRGRELTQEIGGRSHGSMIYVCASPQNTSVKSVGHCQLVSSWESSGCVGFPFSALPLMWAGILGGRVGESCVWLAEALRIWEVHQKHGNKVVSVMRSHSPRTMMEMSETVVVCTFLFFWNKFWCKSLGRVISKVENLVFYKHETAVLFAEGFTEKLLFLEV